jgi:hypothetical protein
MRPEQAVPDTGVKTKVILYILVVIIMESGTPHNASHRLDIGSGYGTP